MNRIEKYVESICKNIDGNLEDKDNLKEEISYHIRQMVKEYMDQGKSEDESITAALNRFGESNKIGKELSKEYKTNINFKRLVAVSSIAIVFLLGILLGYSHYKANQWIKELFAPDGVTIRKDLNSPLIEGTITFQDEIQVYDKQSINRIVDSVKNSKYKRSCSEKESDKFHIDDVVFSIGTVVHKPVVPQNTLSIINVFKDGSFIASKNSGNNRCSYIKGILSKDALNYIRNVYENPPENSSVIK